MLESSESLGNFLRTRIGVIEGAADADFCDAVREKAVSAVVGGGVWG